jgi:hypothetical protein
MSCHVDISALRAVSNVSQVDSIALYSTSAARKRSGLASIMRMLGLVSEAFREANEMRRHAHVVRRIDNE